VLRKRFSLSGLIALTILSIFNSLISHSPFDSNYKKTSMPSLIEILPLKEGVFSHSSIQNTNTVCLSDLWELFILFTLIAIVSLLLQRKTLKKYLYQIKQREQTIRALYKVIPDLIFRLKKDGTIIDYKSSEKGILYKPPEEFLGKKITEILPEDIGKKIFHTLQIAFIHGGTHTIRYSLTLPTGTGYFEARLIRCSSDEAIGIVRDITEDVNKQNRLMQYQQTLETLVQKKTIALKQRVQDVERLNRALLNVLEELKASNIKLRRITEELKKSNEELETFAYSVSHDLRAPLRAIQGFAEILLNEYNNSLDIEGISYVQRIIKATRKMDHLIEDILQYSRVSAAEPLITMVDLKKTLKEALHSLEGEIRTKGAKIIIKEPLPNVKATHTLLLQALENLLSNAIKFVPENRTPEIVIWTEKINGRIRIYIKDNGIGISEDKLERIFRLFERLHGEESYTGTGVGLAIVKKAIEKMGGSVGVSSQPEKGSVFWIELHQYHPYK